MAISGYGMTVSASVTGAITADVESLTVGGLTLDFSEVKQLDDTNRIPTNLPMTLRDSPLELVMTYDETLYNTLRALLVAQTSRTWTITGSDSSTHVSAAWVSSMTGLNYDSDGHATYSMTITPATTWAFTAV